MYLTRPLDGSDYKERYAVLNYCVTVQKHKRNISRISSVFSNAACWQQKRSGYREFGVFLPLFSGSSSSRLLSTLYVLIRVV